MTKILVDADACPVKNEIVRVAERYSLKVHFVSNQYFRLPKSSLVEQTLVPNTYDSADDWIVENALVKDIVVTADIQLAARCLGKGAVVIGNTGQPFDSQNIGNALAMRQLNAYLRDIGELHQSGHSFGKRDRSRFLQTLNETIMGLKRF